MTRRLPAWLRPRRPRVVVYTRQQCGLCAAAERTVASLGGRVDAMLVDVDTDAELQRRYHVRVPVVVVDGTEVAEGRVNPADVRRAVRAARFGPGRANS